MDYQVRYRQLADHGRYSQCSSPTRYKDYCKEVSGGDDGGEKEEVAEGEGVEKEEGAEEGADEELNDSGGLNSSNSNIEEEFEEAEHTKSARKLLLGLPKVG